MNTAAFCEVSYFGVLRSDLVSLSAKWPSEAEELVMLSWEILLVVIVKHLLSCISYTNDVYI